MCRACHLHALFGRFAFTVSSRAFAPCGQRSIIVCPAAEVLSTYVAGGWLGLIHNVTLTNLQPRTVYYYRVGNAKRGFSPVFSFRTLPAYNPAGSNTANLLVVADMGFDSQTLNCLQNVTAAGNAFDALVHAGDTAYADGVQQIWDQCVTSRRVNVCLSVVCMCECLFFIVVIVFVVAFMCCLRFVECGIRSFHFSSLLSPQVYATNAKHSCGSLDDARRWQCTFERVD